MSDRIKCIRCGAESYNVYGKTPLTCATCYEALLKERDELKAENEKLKQELIKLRPITEDCFAVYTATEWQKMCDELKVQLDAELIGYRYRIRKIEAELAAECLGNSKLVQGLEAERDELKETILIVEGGCAGLAMWHEGKAKEDLLAIQQTLAEAIEQKGGE